MAFTQDQANAYYNTLTPDQKAAVDASGGPRVEWLQNAVNAGVPDAILAAGGRAGTPEGGGWEAPGGAWLDPSGAAPSSEWLGKRMPTPQEFRLWAQQQHAAYLAGDRTAQDEDYARYSDRQIAAWLAEGWDPAAGSWRAGWNPTGRASDMAGGGGGGAGGGGGGRAYSGATTGYGGAPAFQYTPFNPALPGETTTDPSYLFRLNEGIGALERSAAARGVLRTGGTLKDIMDYGQEAASQEYGNIFNRGLQTWGAQYQGEKDAFAPMYGSWQTVYGGDLAKYLQKENNIYGLLSQPPPYYG